MKKEELHGIAQSHFQEFKELSDYIYDHPEMGFEEFKSSKAHVDLLRKHGFDVEYPYLGFETAFRATYDSGKPGPTIAYLSEFDALPGIGHGCGHNMLGTVDTGAGIVLSKVLDEIGGRVIVLGTPAEETSGVKVDMAAADTFDDIDVAMCTHPSDINHTSGASMAMEALEFEFYGKNAHAAASPWMGVNALDAVINQFNLINAQRQQFKYDWRVHGIVVDGGEAANIIPDYTRTQFYVRALKLKDVEKLRKMVIQAAESAAAVAGCRMEYNFFEKSYHNMITNPVLSDLYNQNAADLGVEMIPKEEDLSGSIDMGNVSQVVPAIHPYYEITDGVRMSGHTPEFRDCTKTEFGYQAMIRTIEILARTGYDVITRPEVLQSIKENFEASKE